MRPVIIRSATALLALLVIGTVALAPAAQAKGWGWERLNLSALPAWQASAVRDALVAAQPVGVVDARRQALALLVTAGTVTQGQADLLAMMNRPSLVDALVRTGHMTKAQGEAVKQVIRGTSVTQNRYSTANIALGMLIDQGLLTSAQAADVQGQLSRLRE